MQKRLTSVVLAVLLLSITGNIWQGLQNRRMQKQTIDDAIKHDSQFVHIKRDLRELSPEDPILGLSVDDLSAIVDCVIEETRDNEEDRILSIKRQGHTTTIVRTGYTKGPLYAQGQIFIFELVQGKWTLKDRSNTMS